MRTCYIVTSTLVVMLAAGAHIVAHHSFAAEFDGSTPVTLRGTITKMEWTNPHAWLHVDVKGTDGKIVPWMIEGGAPNALLRRGWRKEDLPAGTVLKVEGWQARNGSPTANVSSITFSDGKRLFAGSSNPNAPQQ